MNMTLKTMKNVLWAQHSFQNHHQTFTIDVRKKSDLSQKNRTTGSCGDVWKIWDWPQPASSQQGGYSSLHPALLTRSYCLCVDLSLIMLSEKQPES